jgi:hypothetical protein
MFLVQTQDMVARLVNILRYSFSKNETTRFRWRPSSEVVSDSRVSSNDANRSRRFNLYLLQEHVIVSLVRDCYSHAVAWS